MKLAPGPALILATFVLLGLQWIAPQTITAQDAAPFAEMSCDQIVSGLSQAPAAERFDLAMAALSRPCKPLPDPIRSALEKGIWPDGREAGLNQRLPLLTQAVTQRYVEAETLAVAILENGVWPDGTSLDLTSGGDIIQSLEGALTPYRVRLLLDVFEQIDQDYVRYHIIKTLRASDEDAALLPALSAFWDGSSWLQQAALATIGDQPEETPGAVLARLIGNLPEGPLLNWALRLANQHPSSQVAGARRDRGL